MKKITFLFFLALSFVAKSQTYHPFPMMNSEWDYTGVDIGNTFYAPYVVTLDDSTIINSNKYFLFGIGQKNYSVTDTFLLREDSTKKVYFRYLNPSHSSSDTGEIVAYDFNLAVGDTFIQYHLNTSLIPDTFHVTGIDSVLTNLGYLKHCHFYNQFAPNVCELNYIEGIGSEFNFTWFDFVCFEYLQNLTCMYENQNHIYGDSAACATWGIQSSFKNDFIKILPNPAANFVFLNLNQNFYSSKRKIELKNIFGQTVFQKEISTMENQLQINVSEFPAGVYFIFLLDEKGIFTSSKLIKE